ncbi:MAG: amidase [Clostridiales bacterium]|nr:amidase [Clostridiales bacterium]
MYYFRTPGIFQYNRDNAVRYAHEWAFKRNPRYLDFENYGGDCTNFASQVIYAGSGIMNYTPTFGWYYENSNNRTPSWTGVNYLYNFLVNNNGIGPFAEVVDQKDIVPGDIVQLSLIDGINDVIYFEHSLVIVQTGNPASVDNILTATHTYNTDNHPLNSYEWNGIRFLHIVGVRKN